jgi:hypothetical protein
VPGSGLPHCGVLQKSGAKRKEDEQTFVLSRAHHVKRYSGVTIPFCCGAAPNVLHNS